MGKLIDISGQIFGELTAKEYIKELKKWRCICSCGKESFVTSDKLRSGHTKSCGHLKNNIKNDLKGKQFGKWTVIGEHFTKNKRIFYPCVCDCGNKANVRSDQLLSGSSLQCQRCSHNSYIKDEIGNQYDYLIVKSIAPKQEHDLTHTYWYCNCLACGAKNVIICGAGMRKGDIHSCGCITSKGENAIQKILVENKISFKQQKTFDNCIFLETKAKLRFDFYLPDYNCCIEYDGEGHFKQVANWDFEKQKERDKYKNQWCKENNIILIRIPYIHYDDLCLEDLLPKTSNFIYQEDEND